MSTENKTSITKHLINTLSTFVLVTSHEQCSVLFSFSVTLLARFRKKLFQKGIHKIYFSMSKMDLLYMHVVARVLIFTFSICAAGI